MNAQPSTTPTPGGFSLTPSDIYFIIFRHKWKIIVLAMIGLIAGAVTYLLWPDSYISRAQILIKYVTESREVVNAGGSVQNVAPEDQAIATELAILKSMDLAMRIDENSDEIRNNYTTPDNPETELNPYVIKQGFSARKAGRNSNIINLRFEHANREIATAALQQSIATYLEQHFEIHRNRGTFDDFLVQQTDQAKARLMQTEEELIAERRKAGLISVEQARENLAGEISRIYQLTNDTKANLAENQSLYDQLTAQLEEISDLPAISTQDETEMGPDRSNPESELAGAIREFGEKKTQLDILRSRAKSLLTRFTPESTRYKAAMKSIATVEKDLFELKDKYPELFSNSSIDDVTTSDQSPQELAQNARLQQTKITSLQSRLDQLNKQMGELQADANRIDQVELAMKDLQRRKALEESNYRTLLANLEKNRLADAQMNGEVSNITVLQSPTPAQTVKNVKAKTAGMITGGFLFAGLAWAFLIELLFDQSIKRPIEIRKTLGIPLFLTLPDTNSKTFRKHGGSGSAEIKRITGKLKASSKADPTEYKPKSGTLLAAAKAKPELYGTASNNSQNNSTSPWEEAHPLHNYFEALRDKVISYFESRNLNHKPKLIGMTGLGKAPGVTTIASGLASSLSKTEGGNVLLVDMTLGQESAQQFYKGQVVGNIDEALESKENTKVSDKFYVVAEGSNGFKLPSILPSRFNNIIPKLKASDFDYIIFDMPPVSPISSTPRLASFMDITMMVVESEETPKELAKQAAELLAESNVQLGAILNKTKNYVPKQLSQDLVGLS